MVCKYFKKNAEGQPICQNSDMTEVKYCPFEFTMKKKAPQCCRGYAKGARRAYRNASSDKCLQKIAHAIWVALPFYSRPIKVTVENECGDTIMCSMSPDGTGQWKVHNIRTDVDGGHVLGKFRKALHRQQ